MNTLEFALKSINKNKLQLAILVQSITLIILTIILIQATDTIGVHVSLILLSVVSIFMLVQTVFFLRHRYTNAIMNIEEALQKIAKGDLSFNMAVDKDEEIEGLTRNIRHHLGNTTENLSQLSEAILNIDSVTIEVHKSTDVLDQSINNQSANCQVVKTAIEKMVYAILSNAELDSRAVKSSEDSGIVAKQGGEAVNQTILKIQNISDVVKQSVVKIGALGKSCEEVESMAASVQNIATQTNLLALNAAIEAARAGEHGRGFSVVADEVRSLANNTTAVTNRIVDVVNAIREGVNDTTALMQLANTEVADGIELADKAGSALNDIVTETQSMLNVIKEIASAGDESANTGIDKVAYHLDQVSCVSGESETIVNDAVKHMQELKIGMAGWRSLTHQRQELMANLNIQR